MSHSEWFERGSQKFSHKKILLTKRCQMESAVPEILALTGQSSSLEAVFYSIDLHSLYVDRVLQENTGIFYSYEVWESKNK